jgi:hypothetical protein
MNTQNFTVTLSVDQTPEEVFDAINDVRGWWSGEVDGRTDELGAEFTYSYKDVHRTTQKITELVPGKKVVWHVVESHINFVADKTEWDGTDIVFEITRKGDKTELRFTHVGLVPDVECYGGCSGAWGFYIQDSLRALITTGKGQPNEKVQRVRDRREAARASSGGVERHRAPPAPAACSAGREQRSRFVPRGSAPNPQPAPAGCLERGRTFAVPSLGTAL